MRRPVRGGSTLFVYPPLTAMATATRDMPSTDLHWFDKAARVGYATKGVVYTIIGVLAVQTAFGSGGETTGSRGAIRTIAEQPFGNILLWITGIGLICYAIYRLFEAAVDPRHYESGLKNVVQRIGYAVSGLIYGALAYFTFQIAAGSGSGGGSASGGSGGSTSQSMTAELLSQPFGQWLVGAVGVILFGVAGYQFYKAWGKDPLHRYDTAQMDRKVEKVMRRAAKAGFTARGVTYGIIGTFVIQAALQSDASEAKGLGAALTELASQPYGPWLLAAVAIGLVCYGAYCFVAARYARFETE